VRLEAKTACVFLCQIITPDIRMKPGYTDAFWASILLMVYMILIKNKNKNKNKNKSRRVSFVKGEEGIVSWP